jgi:UDP-2,3-diacylglucosamine hydrolase
LTTLFISDLHLQPSQPQSLSQQVLLRACLSWLSDTARNAEALYILGDLFEAWVGDDDDAPWLDELSGALRELSERGTQLYFMHGNRDFLLGAAFAQRCGMTLLPESTVIDLYGRKALLLHGDTLCTEDREYLAFREQVRNPLWQQVVLSKSLAERRVLASALRNESKMAGSAKEMAIMDVTGDEVERVLREAGIDLLIHGHTHRPARHSVSVSDKLGVSGKTAERIVLGDWSSEHGGWYIRAESDGSIDLIQFPLL